MNSPRDTPAFAGRLLLGAAAGISLYLAAMALAHTPLPGCGAESPCQDVMQSRWAYTFGIPVSFPGFVLYVLTLLLSWAYVRRERTLAGLHGGMAVSAVLAGAVWFTALQVFALQSVCLWCCLAHGCALLGAWLLWRSRRQHPAPGLDCTADLRDAGSPLSNDRVFRFTATGAALAGVGLLALGSLSGPLRRSATREHQPDAPAVTPSAGGLSLLGGKFRISPDEYPGIGKAGGDARTAVLLSDYTCEWCLKYHGVLENVAAGAMPPLRIVVLPVARTPDAEDIQRTMLTVFHADRAAWRSLSALVTSGQIPATVVDVGRAALSLVGAENFAAAAQAHADKIEQQLQLAAAVLRESRDSKGGSTVLPQLLCGGRVLTGAESDQAKVLAWLNDNAPASPHPEPAPVLAVLNDEVALDSMLPSLPRDLQIKVQNKGDAPLQLGWLVLDTGCEVTRMPDRKLYPGETAAIGLRITAPAADGSFTRRLRIHSNAPGAPGSVTLRGTVAAGVASTSPAR